MLDKVHAFSEPNVRAVAFELFELPVSFVGIVEVVVAPVVRRLADSATTMPDNVLKTAVLRSMRSAVSEVPLTNHARRVTRAGEKIGNGLFIGVHHRSPRTGTERAGDSGVIAGHQ